MLNEKQIQRISELYEKATKGKWHHGYDDAMKEVEIHPVNFYSPIGVQSNAKNDAALICELYNMIPDLLS